MAWNDLTREQMETQLIRQAQVIGVWRSALEKVVEARMPGQARSIAREALRAYQQCECKRCGGSKVEKAIAGNGYHWCPDCQVRDTRPLLQIGEDLRDK